METVLQIRNLTKKVNKKVLLEDINLDLFKGEILGLIGPNGAGKSTTLKTILGLASASDGSIIPKNSLSNNRRAWLGEVGCIVENPSFYEYMSGYDNLWMLSKLYGKRTKKEILEIAELVKLTSAIHKKVSTYSLGMKQRLGVAQSLIHNPQILILDEPTNGLDPQGVIDLRNLLISLAKEKNLSILISSHQLSELDLLCDRFVFINNGRIVQVQSKHQCENKKISYTILVQPLQKALDLINEKFPHTNPTIKDQKLIVQLLEIDISEITKFLISNDLNLSEVYVNDESLEETYLKLIKEG
ncbi:MULTISPECIES: ABC transporter ATP-binding protein [unclassified Lysinibacillus]|uniref:ABC transporter ATP-binding protein n=1 Tax=unclassified Lysinibacillus TaxID=2636778 RepID=UPI002013AA97|nr:MULTISPECIES: ABC transporter ATP-binding protein [unclassified Lysinibacillus]MCL1695623.1 ABC transporter ATP-binding protein [Lysinibacillus sp. BPa_S21]MCL1700132.1 ABC transporter ATP-binding protein [Lysinibacillus sp. Bpr_S20]